MSAGDNHPRRDLSPAFRALKSVFAPLMFGCLTIKFHRLKDVLCADCVLGGMTTFLFANVCVSGFKVRLRSSLRQMHSCAASRLIIRNLQLGQIISFDLTVLPLFLGH